jgi:Sulfotransferase domain
MGLPNFFIIGAAKTGTTSLHYYLDQHPEIQMSVNKEPNFFSGPANGIPYPMGRVETIEEYEELFDEVVPLRGEASVGYTNHPRRQNVPEKIKEVVPDARFIYLVRDPVARTVSQYHHRVALEGERRSLGEALGDLSDPYSPYLGPSLYMSQLDLYLRHFPSDRLMIVDQAELLSDRRSTLREIFSFLGADDAIDSSCFDNELNTGTEHRLYPPRYTRLLGPVSSPLASWVPRSVRRSARRSVERLLWRPVEKMTLEDVLRERLEHLFSKDVQRLRAFTGKSFPTWSI